MSVFVCTSCQRHVDSDREPLETFRDKEVCEDCHMVLAGGPFPIDTVSVSVSAGAPQ